MTAHSPDATNEAERSRDVALKLMRLALPLLDRAGETLAAARLQHTVDTVMRSPPMTAEEEHDIERTLLSRTRPLDRVDPGAAKRKRPSSRKGS